jgi:uncharacterized cofD-like protein
MLLPMSEEPTSLEAEGPEGSVSGETAVSELIDLPRRLWLSPEVSATPEVLKAIAGADLILMAPGSLVTSVLPPLLLRSVREAVIGARCPRVLIANLVPEPGPVGALSLSDQLAWMEEVVGACVVDGVLWPASRDLGRRPEVPTQVADMVAEGAADNRGRHDRDKLTAALAAMLRDLRALRQKSGHAPGPVAAEKA